jgi:hypothetical protein
MILRKNEESDEFSLLIKRLVDNEGGKRKPFVKAPLSPKRRSFPDWLLSVVRFKRDPFKASPFASEIGLRERTEQSCEEAKSREEAASPEQETIVVVNVRFKYYALEAFDAADEATERFDGDLREHETNQNRCRPENLKTSLLTFFKEQIGGLKLAFAPFARDHASAAVSLQELYERISLNKKIHWGKELATSSVAGISSGKPGRLHFECNILCCHFFTLRNDGMLGGVGRQ